MTSATGFQFPDLQVTCNKNSYILWVVKKPQWVVGFYFPAGGFQL